ncbi:MAG TPA: toll/interleukin-1 receptor domain-containing protein [Thermoanaerobaculia bacterium]|nr:toll/interleukin-1 receptor domain-containing protein [Thermoanaerobaculia bacterium]
MLEEPKEGFDVFLSHHSADKAVVTELAGQLRESGLSVFLDSDGLVPGELWMHGLEAALLSSRAFIVCLGPSGLGQWTLQEVNVALDRAVRDPTFTVIPVLLPGANRSQQDEVSAFLRQYQFLDLRGFPGDRSLDRLLEVLRAPSRRNRLPGALTPALIEPALERLQDRFFQSIQHHLAGAQLIRRKETRELMTQLDEETSRVTVIHGVAGSGKSGVLFELARELVAQGVPFLPLRLDRYELHGDPQRFGKEALGLPGSPAKCLAAIAAERRGVLLLDQVDAMRWTSAHASEAWDVCREVISEALASTATLKVVVCCRTFDLRHDPQLRAWEQGTQNLRQVEVQQLSLEEVLAAVQRAAEGRGSVPILRSKEQALLRHIHHLQMWLAIYESTKSAPVFDTSWALMESFWASRLNDLAKNGIDPARAEELERRLVAAVQAGAVLSAPVRKLEMSDQELNLYQEHHLLQVDERGTFTFCHQSYQDYLVAKHLLRELDQTPPEQGGRRVVAWLGDRKKQSIFRREQLRLLLGALRAEEHEAYLPTLREFLPVTQPDPASLVRFHLCLLALQFLGQVADPRPEEVALVLALLDQPFWRDHVLGEIVRGQVPWFEALDDHCRFEAWLAGEDPKLQASALDMLLYVVEKCGDRVARLVAPYLEKDEEWKRRILWVLRFDPSQDSDALFSLRLKLAKEGSYTADHVEWDKLAQSHPDRFIQLVSHVLIAFAASIFRGENRRRPGRRTEIDWHSLEKIGPAVISREWWKTAWKALFRSLSLVTQVRSYTEEPQHVLESYAADFATLKPVLRLLKDLGRVLLEDNWQELVTLGEELSRAHRRAEVLFLDSLVEGPVVPELADWALNWLMADPWRSQLRLRRSPEGGRLPGRLLELYAPVCSPETYRRVEQWLLTYREPDLLESYKYRHERISHNGDLKYPNSFGKTPHGLLPKLPAERRSAEIASRLKELSRKFPAQTLTGDEKDDVKAGWVGSPISEDARSKMGDADWFAIATNERLPARWGRTRFKSDGSFEVASVETFTAEFRNMTQRQPERFAMLALRLPPTDNHRFLDAILSGLAWPGDRQPEGWTPPSHEVLEKILALPAVQALAHSEDKGVASHVCRILQRYSEYPWSERALELLVWIARHHSDPEKDAYPGGSPGEDSEHFDKLENNALNVTRGAAGFAIHNLLFAQPALFARLQPALESLIQNEHPAVRVAALAACLPVINIHRDWAVELFLQGCEGPDAILATRGATEFLRYTYRAKLVRLRPLIERMVASSLPRVATAGAFQVAACFLVEGQLEEGFERCLIGSPHHRKGVAQVAASLLGESEFADKAKATLLRLAEDEDEKVAETVAYSFGQLDLRHITSDREAWSKFARSKAFQKDPSPLLHALDKQAGQLVPFADCLLAVGTTFAEELAEDSQNMATGISGDARQLLPLLLRLYEQAQARDKVLYLRCLDLWDRLLERRVGAAMGLTRELDRL